MKNAPDWAQYLAMNASEDGDEEWYWYEQKPEYGIGAGKWRGTGGRIEYADAGAPQSLERRPTVWLSPNGDREMP